MSKYVELMGRGWARIMKDYLLSEDWPKVRGELKAAMGKNLYPNVDDIFKCFKHCPYDDLIAVFLTTNSMDSKSDGFAFSSVNMDIFKDLPPVQDKIFDAVEADLKGYPYLNRESQLQRWAEQGVLLLNCDLTTIKGKPGEHLKLWHNFMKHLFKHLGQYNTGIIYVLIGNHPQKFEQYINKENNDIFKLEHPMVAVKEKRPWKHQDVFKRINDISRFLNNRSIDWTKNINPWDKPI
jgi:uracil-DNA glycosylase